MWKFPHYCQTEHSCCLFFYECITTSTGFFEQVSKRRTCQLLYQFTPFSKWIYLKITGKYLHPGLFFGLFPASVETGAVQSKCMIVIFVPYTTYTKNSVESSVQDSYCLLIVGKQHAAQYFFHLIFKCSGSGWRCRFSSCLQQLHFNWDET